MAMYFTQFIVHGHGSFPLDMLRYDGCFPSTGDDVANLEGTSLRKVRLIKYHSQKAWLPTRDRWSSFAWSVERESMSTGRACE